MGEEGFSRAGCTKPPVSPHAKRVPESYVSHNGGPREKPSLAPLAVEREDGEERNLFKQLDDEVEMVLQEEAPTENGEIPEDPIEVEVGKEAEEYERPEEHARAPRIRTAPKGPTKSEREEHELVHLLYRGGVDTV